MNRKAVALPMGVAALVACAGSAQAGVLAFQIALLEGDSVAGVGNATLINNVAINNFGKWLVEADTNNADTTIDEVILLNGIIKVREGQALLGAPPTTLGSFDSVNLNNNADSGWNFFLDGQPTNLDSGIYFNDVLVMQESTISSSPVFGPNTPYIGWFDAKMNDSNQIMMVASIDDPNIATTVDRAMVRLDYNAGAGTYVENVISKEADLIAGNAIADFSTGPHESAINNSGDLLYVADTTAATTVDGFLMLNNTVLAQEGVTEPTPGRQYEFLLGRGLDLNNNGEWVIRTNLTGSTTDDECIVKNGAIMVQEGTSIPAIGAFTFENFGLASGSIGIADNGDVLWYGDWNDPNTNIDTGLFLDDQLIVQEGVTMIGGFLVDSIANGQDAFALSDNGRWVIFEGTVLDQAGVAFDGAFVIEIPSPGAAGVLGLAALTIASRRRRV